MTPIEIAVYYKDTIDCLQLIEIHSSPCVAHLKEVRIVRCGGPKIIVVDFNPMDTIDFELSLRLWGDDWLINLDWDPKEWQWQRICILAETTVLNYTTKRGYKISLQQNNYQIKVH